MVDVHPVPCTGRFSIHLPFNYPESIPSAELYLSEETNSSSVDAFISLVLNREIQQSQRTLSLQRRKSNERSH